MSENNGSASAFPTDYEADCETCKSQIFGVTPHPGLTKREYFAGLIMAALITKGPSSVSNEYYSAHAVKAADFLLAALE